MPDVLHSRTHSVSHFQISLVQAGATLREFDVGGTLVNFADREINVTTAWDDNGTVPPDVTIEITGCTAPGLAGFPPLLPAASAAFDVSSGGIEVGNWISGDIAKVAIPPGRYWVLVSLDTLEPYKARRLHFHFWTA